MILLWQWTEQFVKLTIMDGTELKRRRERLGMSQEELAKILDVAPQSVSRYERDAQPIPRVVELALKEIERQHR